MKYLVFLSLAIAASANAASFDCQKASTFVEKEICSTEILRRLDDAMEKNYKGSLATDIGEDGWRKLKSTQRQWLKERNRCKSAACIEKTYRARIDDLCTYVPATGVNWGCVAVSEDIR
jgi:uncharacterized protein